MSSRTAGERPIPGNTPRAARAAFPKRTPATRLADQLGATHRDEGYPVQTQAPDERPPSGHSRMIRLRGSRWWSTRMTRAASSAKRWRACSRKVTRPTRSSWSTTGSGDAPETVAGRYPGVRLIRQPNMGLAAARNTGLNAATADLITFLDADDRLLPNALASGIAALAERPGCAFAFGGHRRVAADGTPLGSDVPPSLRDGLSRSALGQPDRNARRGGLCPPASGGSRRLRRERCLRRGLRALPPAGATPPDRGASRDGRRVSAARREHVEHSAKMLSSGIEIHNRQRAAASLDPGFADAWRQGQASWRNYYRAALRSAGSVALDDLPPALASASLGDLDAVAPSATNSATTGEPPSTGYTSTASFNVMPATSGRALEIGEDRLLEAPRGRPDNEEDVFHVHAGNPAATIVGDLSMKRVLPAGASIASFLPRRSIWSMTCAGPCGKCTYAQARRGRTAHRAGDHANRSRRMGRGLVLVAPRCRRAACSPRSSARRT